MASNRAVETLARERRRTARVLIAHVLVGLGSDSLASSPERRHTARCACAQAFAGPTEQAAIRGWADHVAGVVRS